MWDIRNIIPRFSSVTGMWSDMITESAGFDGVPSTYLPQGAQRCALLLLCANRLFTLSYH